MDNSPGRSKSPNLTGCGPAKSVAPQITLNISTTTGGTFSVVVNSQNCIDTLKKIISKKLKVVKDRICLLHRERQLQEGTLKANGLQDGSKILLIPNVETGLLAQRPENTVMQALESLNDSQVNDFLSGKTPLNLSMRLGDHMMLIQLQLSTVNPSVVSATSTEGSNSSVYNEANINSLLAKQDFENLQNIVKNLTMVQNPSLFADTNVGAAQLTDIKEPKKTSICGSMPTASLLTSNVTDTIKSHTLLEQSPIKSLSNLVSTSIKATSIKQISKNNTFLKSVNISGNNNCADPISANLTSCLCKQLNSSHTIQKCEFTNCKTCANIEVDTLDKNEKSFSTIQNSSLILHKTANNPIERSKHKSYQHYCASNINRQNVTNLSESQNHGINRKLKATTCISNSNTINITSIEDHQIATVSGNEKRTLAEASRNLTQTLRKLSKEVFTNKMEFSEETSRKNSSVPVIESMKNHGKGIYSGTFSGTLNPALQDRYGRPKRDISTVIHILNDLLSATPHYSRGTRISFHAPSPSRTDRQISLPDVCVKCFNSTNVGECEDHSTLLSTTNQNETNSEILLCHKNITDCQSSTSLCNSHKDSKYSNNQMCTENMSNILNNDRNNCTCGVISFVDSTNLTEGSIPNNSVCNKCTIELENSNTKYKLEQLKVVMQQRRQRREARKLKNSPYGGRISNTNITNCSQSTSDAITALASPSEVSSQHVAEELDTAA